MKVFQYPSCRGVESGDPYPSDKSCLGVIFTVARTPSIELLDSNLAVALTSGTKSSCLLCRL